MRSLSTEVFTAVPANNHAGKRVPCRRRLLDIASFRVLSHSLLRLLKRVGVDNRFVCSFDIILGELAVIANQAFCEMVGNVFLLKERIADVLLVFEDVAYP